jgi:hypothetical protein
MKQKILARRPSDLTIDWAQRVVKNGYPNVIVSNVTTVSVDIDATTRVRLAIEHYGPAALPRRWFVKLPSLNWRPRLITALPGLLHIEVGFYKEAAHALPLAVPGFLPNMTLHTAQPPRAEVYSTHDAGKLRYTC